MTGDTFLSEQQETIVELLDDGNTWAEAAEELDISQKTLEEQMRRVSEKRDRCERTIEFLEEHGR